MNIKRLPAFFLSLIIPVISFAQTKDPVVHAGAGSVSGVVQNGIHIFKGIPFAASPVGELRWKAPQLVQRRIFFGKLY